MTLIEETQTEPRQDAAGDLPAAARGDTLPDHFKLLYAPIAQELVEVERILKKELVSRDPQVNTLLQHGLRLGGKRLRPALLLLTASASGESTRDHILLAAVMEMIHTATLVHDDVLDEASLRRHHETINAKAGNQASVLLGDFLFSHAFYLASTLSSTFACQRIGRSTNIVCEGEMRQIDSQGNYAIREPEYLEIINAKTAELCACCCELGAHYAGTDAATQQSMRQFGRNLGMAFQVIDDLLDVEGDERQAGKSLGTDFLQEKMTLPLIHLLGTSEEGSREQLQQLLQQPPAARNSELKHRLDRAGSLDYAHRRAADYADAAKEDLNALPASPSRDALEHLTEFVVRRAY